MTKKSKLATANDPVLAAMAEARRLDKAWHRLSDALDRAEAKARETHGPRPCSLIAWRDYSAIGGSEIEGGRERYLNMPEIDPKKIEEEYQAAKARERAAKLAGIEWDKRAGIAAQRRECALTLANELKAHMQMAKTAPTTPAGAAALLAYVKADMKIGLEFDWHDKALGTLIDALKAW